MAGLVDLIERDVCLRANKLMRMKTRVLPEFVPQRWRLVVAGYTSDLDGNIDGTLRRYDASHSEFHIGVLSGQARMRFTAGMYKR